MAELALWQGEYRGLIFGVNTPYNVVGDIALFAATSKSSDVPLPRADGAIPNRNYLANRDLIIPFVVYGGVDHQANADALRTLLLAFSVTSSRYNNSDGEEWLRFRTRTGVYRLRADPHRLEAPIGPQIARSGGYRATVLLTLADPRVYGDDDRTVVIAGASASGATQGWELPAEFPWDASGSQFVGNPLAFINEGNGIANPILTVYNGGAATLSGFEVTEQVTGQEVSVTQVIAPGDTFKMDFDALVRGRPGPHITLNNVNRYASWDPARVPLGLPGGQNSVRFDPKVAGVVSSQPLVTLTINYYDTYD